MDDSFLQQQNPGLVADLDEAAQKRKLEATAREVYTHEYYDRYYDESFDSAVAVLKYIKDHLFDFRSMTDFGCGEGAWCDAAIHRLNDPTLKVLGIDGEWVKPRFKFGTGSTFIARELSQLVEGLRSDLAICMEVGEHLLPMYAPILVRSLCDTSDVVLFSAAIPGQGGVGHVNEQWQSYWANYFMAEGFYPVDCLRKKFWQADKVAWWYRQNMILYVKREQLQSVPTMVDSFNVEHAPFDRLRMAFQRHLPQQLLDVAHPELVQHLAYWKNTLEIEIKNRNQSIENEGR